jgi:hypothetical protein
MKIERENISIIRSGEFEEAQFRVKASPKAFDILSSKLYSDPILAIIRELSTNAWDSHAEANILDKPFVVHLPNRMEPFFYIRDFGIGMSHKDIMTLYTTYFESTKTETNEQAGCLGIGSKSPFSYTDSFSVTSWFKGKKRVYNMFKGEEGFPKVALMQTIDSDGHNGIEVRFACRIEDIKAFIQKAEKVYENFSITPEFRGNSKLEFKEEKVILSGNGWKVYPLNRYHYDKSYAIMGPIGYPINSHHLSGDAYRLFLNTVLRITFPIGSLEIAASREDLQYSELTKKNLTKAAKSILKEMGEKVSQKLENCKTLWEARQLSFKIFKEDNSSMGSLKEVLGPKIVWKGLSCDVRYKGIYSISSAGSCTLYKLTKHHDDRLRVRRTNDESLVECHSGTQLMIDDLDSKSGEKIRSWMKHKGKGVKNVYVIELYKWDKEHEDRLHNILGTTPNLFIPTSTLPKPKRSKSKTTSGKRSNVPIASRGFIFNPNISYHGGEKASWTPEIIDISNPGIYVSWRRNQAVTKENTCVSPNSIKEMLKGLESINKKPDKIYAFKAGYLYSVLEKEPKWKDFFEYAKESLEEFIKSNKLEEQIELNRKASSIGNFRKYDVIASQLDNNNSPLKKFVTLIEGAKQISNQIKIVIDLGERLGYEFKETNIDLRTKEKEIKSRYPMLDYISCYGYYERDSGRIKDAIEYVKLVDEAKDEETSRKASI